MPLQIEFELNPNTESSSKHVLSKLHSELYQMTPRIKTYHKRKRQKCDNLDEFYKEHVISKIGMTDKKKVVGGPRWCVYT